MVREASWEEEVCLLNLRDGQDFIRDGGSPHEVQESGSFC